MLTNFWKTKTLLLAFSIFIILLASCTIPVRVVVITIELPFGDLQNLTATATLSPPPLWVTNTPTNTAATMIPTFTQTVLAQDPTPTREVVLTPFPTFNPMVISYNKTENWYVIRSCDTKDCEVVDYLAPAEEVEVDWSTESNGYVQIFGLDGQVRGWVWSVALFRS